MSPPTDFYLPLCQLKIVSDLCSCLIEKIANPRGWLSGLGLEFRCLLFPKLAVGGAVKINPKCAQACLGYPTSPQKNIAMVHVVLFLFFSKKIFCSLNIRNMDGPVH